MADERQQFKYINIHNKAQIYSCTGLYRDTRTKFTTFVTTDNNAIDRNSYISGQSYKDNVSDDSKKSNVDYRLIKTNVDSAFIKSDDGSFNFDGLSDDQYFVMVTDPTGQYDGKVVELTPKFDYMKAIKVTCIYFVGDVAWFRIKYFGDPVLLSISSNVGVIERVDDNNFKLTNASKPVTITVHDYIEDGEVTIKEFNYYQFIQ